jgi:hypothetical protein
VHLWFEAAFRLFYCAIQVTGIGHRSLATTATSIGIRKTGDHDLKVYAPFGLEDLFAKTVRANKAQITREIFAGKVSNWLAKWPELVIVPWDEE